MRYKIIDFMREIKSKIEVLIFKVFRGKLCYRCKICTDCKCKIDLETWEGQYGECCECIKRPMY